MEAMLAAVRAADQDTLYSMYFPDGGRVKAAAVAGCVCLDDLTCTECERILGVSFLAIELTARKKLRTEPPVPVARVDAGPGLGPGSHRAERSDKAISSGMVDRLGRESRPPSDGMEESGGAISSMADRPGRGSPPASDGIMGPDAAISSTADHRLVPDSDPPSDGVEGSDAAVSGTPDRPVPGSHPSSDGIERSEAPISSMAERLGPGSMSNGVVEGFEAGISCMAARLGLPVAVGERAKEVFRKMEEARAWPYGTGWKKFRSECPLAYAACLSIACRNEGSALSLRELSLATAGGSGAAARKEIARLIAHIRTRLGVEEAGQATGVGLVSVSSYVRRFGPLVGLREAQTTAALEAARRLEEGVVDVRHNAESLAAGVVCLTIERTGAVRPGYKDIAAATGVSDGTVYTVCRNLRGHDGLLFG